MQFIGFLRGGCPRGGVNLGTLRIPAGKIGEPNREDTLTSSKESGLTFCFVYLSAKIEGLIIGSLWYGCEVYR